MYMCVEIYLTILKWIEYGTVQQIAIFLSDISGLHPYSGMTRGFTTFNHKKNGMCGVYPSYNGI